MKNGETHCALAIKWNTMQPGIQSITTHNMEEPHTCNTEQNNPETNSTL